MGFILLCSHLKVVWDLELRDIELHRHKGALSYQYGVAPQNLSHLMLDKERDTVADLQALHVSGLSVAWQTLEVLRRKCRLELESNLAGLTVAV